MFINENDVGYVWAQQYVSPESISLFSSLIIMLCHSVHLFLLEISGKFSPISYYTIISGVRKTHERKENDKKYSFLYQLH